MLRPHDFRQGSAEPESSMIDVMREESLAERLAVFAGLGTWAVIGVPVLLELAGDGLLEPRWLLWLYSYLSFGMVFGLIATDRLKLPRRYGLAVLGYQTLMAALALALLPRYGFIAILFIITASHAAHVLKLKTGFLWVLGQTLFIGTVVGLTYPDAISAGVQTLAYFGFQLFALLTTASALSEAAARTELARQSAELRATQELLAESSRLAERAHISRELHDLMGHHLAALSLNLEVASHVTEGKAKEHVGKARSLAKLLLADVRGVVSSMRQDGTLDLAGALGTLVEDVPKPRIHLTIPGDLGVDDIARAQVILRCIQEIVTNAVKHSDADNLWLELDRTPQGIQVRARDDGRGSPEVRAGHGLKGMRERLEALGGRLSVRSSPGEGFRLDVWVPLGA
jgi:signal transduction histidine kinase